MAASTEWLEKDYYQVLGVPETASEKEIQRAYRRLAREFHPDANPDVPGAEERFKEIAAAYDVVGDAEKRKEYDELRRLGPGVTSAGGPGGARFSTFRVEDLRGFDLGDLFGDLFGGAADDVGWATRPARGRDLEAELRLGFQKAVFGVTTEVRVGGEAVRVRVPPGVDDGQVIRLPGRGEAGLDGGPPGDLFVAVRVTPHSLFGRAGGNLTVTVPVTYPEAVLGAEVKVPTLDGPPVTVRIPPGTPSGRKLRVRGHGVPRARGGRGDLLVTVEVAVPARVGAEERRAVEALAEQMGGSPRAHLGV